MELYTKNFYGMLKEIADKYADKPAITCEGFSLSFSQLDVASDVCALRLMSLGVKPGDHVVLWGVNTPTWVISYYGILKAGGVAVLMNYGLKGEDVSVLAKMVEATHIVIGGNSVTATDPMGAVKASLEAGVPQDNILSESQLADIPELLADPQAPVADYPESIEKDKLEMLAALNASIDPHTSQIIIYTSGTTSLPKAVQLSSFSILNDALASRARIKDQIDGKALCVALPFFHSYGLICMTLFNMAGSQVVLVPPLKPDAIMDAITNNKTAVFATVPAVYGMLTQHPDFEERLTPILEVCITGGGFTTPVDMIRMEKAFKKAKILCGYGMTETSPVISLQSADMPLEERAVSVGAPIDGIDVKVWKKDEGFVPTGEIGEIVVKGFNLMNGYYNLPDEKQPIDEDGYLHTGDLGFFTEDGVLHFGGREKDIIIRSGENISPVDIEQALMEEDFIKEAKVMGAPHPIWGESVEACITTTVEEIDEDDLRERLKKKLSSYKIPSHFFVYKAFPLNTNGKLDQRSLRADMLNKVRAIAIANSLNEGFTIMSLNLKNRLYNIVPACSMVEEFVEQIGFDARQAARIRLSVEEMITDRINNAYDENGEITFEVQLMPQWLRLKFTDIGKVYSLDSEEASLSAKIIVGNVDAYRSGTNEDGESTYMLDYKYNEDFDVKQYLLYHN